MSIIPRFGPFVPRKITQFLFRNEVIPLEDVHGLLAAPSHNFKVVINSKSKIVNGAVAKIVECKIVQARLGAGCFECFLHIDYRFSFPQKYAA